MAFSSVEFLFVFLPILLLGYTICSWRNTVLLFGSLFFYAWGEGSNVFILLTVIGVTGWVGRMIHTHSHPKRWLTGGICLNLSMLLYVKYGSFLANEVLRLDLDTHTSLPIGVSFFIFQAISYLVDVYRKDAEPAKNLVDVGLYIALFPQLIAGPIVRYNSIASALDHRETPLRSLQCGAILFSLGLGQKVLIADVVSYPADQIFALPPELLSSGLAWISALLFSIQILFDFSGYSLMAIGLGLLFGFHFPENFHYPYSCTSITEFWRRWHISLSRWFRDYVYIPLGGNRKGPMRTMLHLFIVFSLCGLWHGAAWTFLFWGLFHGFFLSIERMGFRNLLERMPKVFGNLYVWIVTLSGWVLFRAETLESALHHLGQMFSFKNAATTPPLSLYLNAYVLLALAIGLLLSYPFFQMYKRLTSTTTPPPFALNLLALVVFLLSCMMILSGNYSPFIYFRF